MIGINTKEFAQMKKIQICGHRGFSAEYPQNTLPSFRAAAELGCDRIEYDLHQTADGHLVVCHNGTVDETSNGSGEIKKMTFEELRKLDFGIRKSEKFAGTVIPEFHEVLDTMNRISPNLFHLIELKVDSVEYAEKVLAELFKRKMTGRFTLVSFHLELLKTLKERHGEILIHGNPPMSQKEFDYEDFRIFDSVGLYIPNVTKEVVQGFHSVGTLVDAWVVDTPEEFRRQAANDVDSVTSNKPKVVLEARDGSR